MANRLSLNLTPLSPIASPPKLSTSLPPIHSHKTAEEKPPPQPPSSYYQESDIFEDIPITLVLPDGVTFKLIVKTGETVQEIKRKLATLHGIPYSDATLYYNGACMIDPLSLNDFPGLVCKAGVCLDVKLRSWRPKESNAQSQECTNKESQKNDSVDHGRESMVSTTSISSLHSISFVEYVDARNSNTSNGYDNTYTNNQHHKDSFEDRPSSPLPLPNAFSDSPNMDKLSRRRQDTEKERTGTTTIDVQDDDDPQCKEIQKLGGNKRAWKICFLF